jgi:hypothetical protein
MTGAKHPPGFSDARRNHSACRKLNEVIVFWAGGDSFFVFLRISDAAMSQPSLMPAKRTNFFHGNCPLANASRPLSVALYTSKSEN